MECKLRPWRADDAEDLAAALNNPKILNNLRDGLPYPYTRKDAEVFIESMLRADPNQSFAFAITVEDKAVGSIAVTRGQNVHRLTGELGYYVAEPYWNQGIGTDAVRQIVAYVFANSDLVRIYAEPFSYNAGSCRILEKNGFEFEGVLRKNAIKNGAFQDMRLYALVR